MFPGKFFFPLPSAQPKVPRRHPPENAGEPQPVGGLVNPVEGAFGQVSDKRLDEYILTRLESLGVDLGVLPEDDPDDELEGDDVGESAEPIEGAGAPETVAEAEAVTDQPDDDTTDE